MTLVLIVDDEETVCTAMSVALSELGFDVMTAVNGLIAIEKIQKHPVDIVLLDIFMPEKDGLETIPDIRRHRRFVKIIAMTGYDEGQFNPLEYARTLGADEAMAKPFSVEELTAVIRSLIGD